MIRDKYCPLLNENTGDCKLRLSDIWPVLPSSWFTVLAPSGELNNACTYSYPEKFKVLKINYDVEQQSLAVVVKEA